MVRAPEGPYWQTIIVPGEGITARHTNGSKVRLDDETGQVSDGYHTFGELYRHRMLLTAALFRDMGPQFLAHKSRLHSDGTCLDGYFVVMATLHPGGQISYHYPLEHWELFDIPERERAAEWDGHTATDVAGRLERYLRRT